MIKKLVIMTFILTVFLMTGCGKIKVDNVNNEYTVDTLSSIKEEYEKQNEEWQKGLTDSEIKDGFKKNTREFWKKYNIKMNSTITVRGIFNDFYNDNNIKYVYMHGIEDGSFLSFTNDDSFADCKKGDVIVISVDYFSEKDSQIFSNAKLVKK